DFVVVLTQKWWRDAHCRRRIYELHWRANRAHSTLGMVKLDHHLVVADLRIVERLFQCRDRTAQEVDGFQLAQPLSRRLFPKTLRQERLQFFTMLDARGVVAEA